MIQHTHTFRVRYPEVDQMGVVHHSRFFQYFEMGRIELLRALGQSYADLEKQGILFVVAKVECSYKSPAHYDDELTLTTKVSRQTAVRIDHTYTLMRGQTLIAQAATTIACLDKQGNIIAIPDSLKPNT